MISKIYKDELRTSYYVDHERWKILFVNLLFILRESKI